MSYDGGQTVTLPTEQEADATWHDSHPNCDVCSKPIALYGADGSELSCGDGCEYGLGEAIMDGTSVAAHVHDDCREKYTLDLAVMAIEESLQVGLPLGMKPWAVDRARNIVTKLMLEFDIKLKGK